MENELNPDLFKRTGSADFPRYLKCLVAGPPKSGKGLANGQLVKTLDGWIPIEDLKVGDAIAHPTHGQTAVVGVFPQGVRPLYRVTTDDGGTVLCDDQHLWTVFPHGLAERTLTTPELAVMITGHSRYAYLPLMQFEAVVSTEVDAPVDPYVLGLLLGDGGLSGSTPRFHKPDPELHEALAAGLPGCTVGDWNPDANSLSITGGKLRPILADLGLCVLAQDKRIPPVYFEMDVESRLELLAGLLDTDGGMSGRSTCFYTSSPDLVAGVQRLVWSLGGSAVVRTKTPSYPYRGEVREGRLAYTVSIRLPQACGNPFRLRRKREAWNSTGTAKRPPSRRIVTIEQVEDGESTCIKVDAPDGLFVTEDFLVTHNTSLLGTMPGILVLDTEPHANNLQSLAHLDVMSATITSTDDLRDVAMILGNDSLRKQLARDRFGTDDIYAVAVDTADSLQKIMKRERMAEQRSTQFMRDDWGWLKTEMEKIIQMFTALPMHVVFTVHLKSQEIGKGDDSYQVVLPGLEGGIAGDIAGMVGYSLLSFRKEEIAADGTPFMKYWLRTEADAVHDFLGTRVNGISKLPTIIEPNFKRVYDAVLASRPAPAAPAAGSAPAAPTQAHDAPLAPLPAPPDADAQGEEVAQNASQSEQVQTPVETPQGSAAAEQAATPPAERPNDEEPINVLAMGHVKRVYESIGKPFPTEIVEKITMGQAREIVSVWKAFQSDAAQGKAAEGTTPQGEMTEYLAAYGWLAPDAPAAPAAAPVEANAEGTIEQIKAYIGSPPDLVRVQEVYDRESAKDKPRTGLIAKLEQFGAKPPTPQPEEVQTPVESSPEPVTSEQPVVDTPATEDGAASEVTPDQAVENLQEGLGAVVVRNEVNQDAKCDECGEPIDDADLADVGFRRFNKHLCVDDYVKLSNAPSNS